MNRMEKYEGKIRKKNETERNARAQTYNESGCTARLTIATTENWLKFVVICALENLFNVPIGGLCWRMVYEPCLCFMLNAKRIQIFFLFLLLLFLLKSWKLETGWRVSLIFGHKKANERNWTKLWTLFFYNVLEWHKTHIFRHWLMWCGTVIVVAVGVIVILYVCRCFCREINEIYGEAH